MLNWIGLIGTALYFLVYFFSIIHFDFSPPSSLNELGDALGGLFAPLAFFWLVIGYYLQREELKLQRIELKESVKALGLQAEELRASVQAQNALVELTKLQVQAEITAREQQEAKAIRDMLPNFSFINISSGFLGNNDMQQKWKIINSGQIAVDIKFYGYLAQKNEDISISLSDNMFSKLGHNETDNLEIRFSGYTPTREKEMIAIASTTIIGSRCIQYFIIKINKNSAEKTFTIINGSLPRETESEHDEFETDYEYFIEGNSF